MASQNLLESLLAEVGVNSQSLADARHKAGPSGDIAIHLQSDAGLKPSDWARIAAKASGLPLSDKIEGELVEPEILKAVSMQYCRRHRILPLALHDGLLQVATSNPFRQGPLDDLRVMYGCEVEPVVVEASQLLTGIDRAFDRAASSSSSLSADADQGGMLDTDVNRLAQAPDLLEADNEAPIIRLVNSIIFQASRDGASDIHIEPFERHTCVRFRIDGILLEMLTAQSRVHSALTSRIKVMASMNIAERRLPQDGGIRTRVGGREVDIRVSTVPTAFGERVVMRLLDRSDTLFGLDKLGLAGSNLSGLREIIHQSHGIVLVTGPTGSGKTTTLYSALSEINSVDKNIITIEDPIEYQIKGIGQIQVNPKIDLSFANGLRSILRQDPDVIMVGEIRDKETARIAIQAALTGHLVFSTLHTNDSFSAITRLLDMEIEPFLVSSSVIAIAAQRLVRKLCSDCSTTSVGKDSGASALSIEDDAVIREAGPGCSSCRGTGYKGRLALSELLIINDNVRRAIMDSADSSTIRRSSSTTTTIADDGADKVRRGLTTVAEVLRVTTVESD